MPNITWFRNCLLVLAILFAVPSASATDCNNPVRPVPAQTSTWYCYRDSDTVVVFIHGILSDNVDAWTNTDKTPTVFWPQLLLDDKANFGEPAIFMAAYPTSINAGEYDIDSAAQAALDSLTIKIEGRPKRVLDFKNIVFVAHSLGGIVSRRLVLMDTDFEHKQLAFVLLASPSLGTDFNYYFKLMAQIVSVKNKLNNQMSFRNEYVDGLDARFREFLRPRQNSITGVELFEALPLGQSPNLNGVLSSFVRTGVDAVIFGKRVASRPVVSKDESYAGYWKKKDAVIPGTDHVSIAKPDSIDATAHRTLAAFYSNFAKPIFESRNAVCPALAEVDLRFKVRKFRNSKWPVLSFLRLTGEDADDDFEPQVPAASKGNFSITLDERLPCPNKELRAEMAVMGWQGQGANSFAVSADEQDAISQYQMSLCFKRGTEQDTDAAKVSFDCRNPENGQCALSPPANNSIAELCERQDVKLIGPEAPALGRTEISVAGMQIGDNAGKKTLYWVTPSLASIMKLPLNKRISFTEFNVQADALPDLVAAQADRFSAAVLVNDTPLYFDGFEPDKLRRKIAGRSSVSYQFGLDSLNFTGANFGYEQIEVRFRFYNGKRLIHTAYSRRPYAANRNYAKPFNDLMQRLTFDSGGTFSWDGIFRPGGSGQDRYAVMLQSAKAEPDLRAAIDKMEAAKTALQGLSLSFEGNRIDARLAAPRTTNSAVGLVLAMGLPSGRTQGAFPLATAEKLCGFLMRNRTKLLESGAMTADVVIYDYDPALYSKDRDIGRFRRTCSSYLAPVKKS